MYKAAPAFTAGSLSALVTLLAVYTYDYITDKLELPTHAAGWFVLLQDAYQPMVWGGLLGLLLVLQVKIVPWFIWGPLLGLPVGLAHLAHHMGWLYEKELTLSNVELLLHADGSTWLLAYALIWGLLAPTLYQHLK